MESLALFLIVLGVVALIWAYCYQGTNKNKPNKNSPFGSAFANYSYEDFSDKEIGEKIMNTDTAQALINVINYAKTTNDLQLKGTVKKIKPQRPSKKLVADLYYRLFEKFCKELYFAKTISQLNAIYNDIISTESDFLIGTMKRIYSFRLENLRKLETEHTEQERLDNLKTLKYDIIQNDVQEPQSITVNEEIITNDTKKKKNKTPKFSFQKNKKVKIACISLIVVIVIASTSTFVVRQNNISNLSGNAKGIVGNSLAEKLDFYASMNNITYTIVRNDEGFLVTLGGNVKKTTGYKATLYAKVQYNKFATNGELKSIKINDKTYTAKNTSYYWQ